MGYDFGNKPVFFLTQVFFYLALFFYFSELYLIMPYYLFLFLSEKTLLQ